MLYKKVFKTKLIRFEKKCTVFFLFMLLDLIFYGK